MKRTLPFLAAFALLVAFSPLSLRAEEGKSIFDGKTLEGWEGDSRFWSVQDGAITGKTTPDNPTKGNTFLIYKGGEVGDFELTLKFRIDGGNSGIQYRSKHHGDFVVGGYQADFDADNGWTGSLYEERGRGVLAKRGSKVVIDADGKLNATPGPHSEKEILESIKKGDWNDYRIVVKGNHLQHYVNGKLTVDVVDNQESKAAKTGILAFQVHAGPPMTVQFKDIILKQ